MCSVAHGNVPSSVKWLGPREGDVVEMASCTSCLRYSCSVSIAALLIMYFLPFLSIFKKPLHLMTHYEVLGVDAAATKSEIMKAFRQQSLIHHPDKQGSGSSKTSQEVRTIILLPWSMQRRYCWTRRKDDLTTRSWNANGKSGFRDVTGKQCQITVQGGTTIWGF